MLGPFKVYCASKAADLIKNIMYHTTTLLKHSLFDDVRHLVDALEEFVRDLGVLEVGLQTQGELQQPRPLGLHGGQVGLDRLRGRVVLRHQQAALLLDRVELTLTAFQLAHHVL